jgi:hypothetical protein
MTINSPGTRPREFGISLISLGSLHGVGRPDEAQPAASCQ